MTFATIVTLVLILKHLKAETLPHPMSNRPCVEFTLPVSVSANNTIYDVDPVNSNIDATQWAINYDSPSTHNSSTRAIQNVTVSGTFDISVQLCVPPTGAKKTNLQVATHGLIFDKRYWDVAINSSEYSYVDAALAEGYSILTYDRLGTGLSDKPDAYTVVQAPLELEILHDIIQQARTGELLQHASNNTSSPNNNSTTTGTPLPAVTFDKIIHVGHSFGSFLTCALLATYPNSTDAAVVTGFIPQVGNLMPTSFEPEFAAQNDPHLFAARGSGYIVPGTPSALQTGFFSARANVTAGLGGFEPALLDYGFEIRQPATITEFLPAINVDAGAAPGYKGLLQFVFAEFDFPVCRGDCRDSYNEDMLHKLYPHAKNITVYVQPGTGHGLTMHRGAKVGYKATLDWLHSNGL